MRYDEYGGDVPRGRRMRGRGGPIRRPRGYGRATDWLQGGRGEYGAFYEAPFEPGGRYEPREPHEHYRPHPGGGRQAGPRGRDPYGRAEGYEPRGGERYAAYDMEDRYGPYELEERQAPYAAQYRARFHGYGMGYHGGAMRSRGSHEAGQLRSGLNPVDEFEFEWGDGYIGGRGYGGTNYDYTHGYAQSQPAERRGYGRDMREGGEMREGGGLRERGEVRDRGGREGGEPRGGASTAPDRGMRGPARYGYGPYHERLQRRRRDDDEIRGDVEDALFYDTWVDADRISVDVADGVVTLHGTLPNYDEVRYATDDAWDVDGVRGVRTDLEVGEESPTSELSRRREYSAAEVAEANQGRREGRETTGHDESAQRGTPREQGGAGIADRNGMRAESAGAGAREEDEGEVEGEDELQA